MTYTRISDEPEFAQKDYKVRYSVPCVLLEDGLVVHYEGTGISPGRHPFRNRINVSRKCRNCESDHVQIIYLRWAVHPMSGDTYWDLELYCGQCKKFSQYSYAGN